MAQQKRIRVFKSVEETLPEETVSEDADNAAAIRDATRTSNRKIGDLYGGDDLTPPNDDKKISVEQLLAKLNAIEPYLEAHFFGNPKGHYYKSSMSKKRRARRAKVLKLLEEIRDQVKYDDFLAQTDPQSYL